ncbi:DnaB-like helicase C-terminal domain-containing protein [Moritella yayanosii]|uniref:Replicative DNA helicase n=1 Tax=Moritella yayanosii TaxID=69539 RepID=A0A330LLZ2_9GAMM|nr:DnaB-like helicase C-terminal domain-containing protein [Moritella yayanosii]SQD77850.1 Replicative DNA helicase [Moritella yayanosii]
MNNKFDLITLDNGLATFVNNKEEQFEKSSNNQPMRHDGLSTGFIDLDKKIGGIGQGLTVIAGRPLNHSDTLQRNILENIILELRNNQYVLHIELGLPINNFYNKMLSSLSSIHYPTLESGHLDDDDWASLSATLGQLMKKPKLVVHNKTTYIEDIQSIVEQMKQEHGEIAVISISSLQDLKTKTTFDNRYAEVCYISKRLKQLSLDEKARVIVGSSVNRKCEERADMRPVLSDLRDSGTIEEDANLILFCYNQRAYNSSAPALTEVIIGKNDFGYTSSIKLSCNDMFSRLDNFLESVE